MAALASLVTGRSGGHPNLGATTSHELTFQPDHSWGAGQPRGAALFLPRFAAVEPIASLRIGDGVLSA
jgi:hypothetical protein